MAGLSERKLLALSQIAGLDRFELEELCRIQVQPVYLGDYTALCRTLCRYKFYVDTRDLGFGSNVLLDGFWEMWLTQFMARAVKPGMVAADIGANCGYYTLLLADLVGAGGHVHAIEPNPASASLLRRSVALNGFHGRTSIAEIAAGGVDGKNLLLFVPRSEPKNATIIASEQHVAGMEGALHYVPTRSMDSLLGGSRLDFVKIDAEGAEEDIIHGMLKTIELHRPDIVLEFNAARYKEPLSFLSRLSVYYGTLRYIDYFGNALPTTPDMVVTERYGEDWLLYFGKDVIG